MKAKIRKTGEIVEIITYSGSPFCNECIDKVSYIDSKGVEHEREPINLDWDFEIIQESDKTSTEINWEQVRINAAIAAMQGLCNSCHESVIRDIQNQNDTERSNV